MRYRHKLTISDEALLAEGRREMADHGYASTQRIADRNRINVKTLRVRINTLRDTGAWTFPSQASRVGCDPPVPINTNDSSNAIPDEVIRDLKIRSLAEKAAGVRQGCTRSADSVNRAIEAMIPVAERLYRPDPSDDLWAGEGGGRSWSGLSLGAGFRYDDLVHEPPDFERWRKEYRQAVRNTRRMDFDRLKQRSDQQRGIAPKEPSTAVLEQRKKFKAVEDSWFAPKEAARA